MNILCFFFLLWKKRRKTSWNINFLVPKEEVCHDNVDNVFVVTGGKPTNQPANKQTAASHHVKVTTNVDKKLQIEKFFSMQNLLNKYDDNDNSVSKTLHDRVIKCKRTHAQHHPSKRKLKQKNRGRWKYVKYFILILKKICANSKRNHNSHHKFLFLLHFVACVCSIFLITYSFQN